MPDPDHTPNGERRRYVEVDHRRLLVWGSFGLLIFGVASYVWLVWYFDGREIPEGLKTILTAVIAAQLVLVKEVYGYVFGSSQQDAAKTQAVAQQAGVINKLTSAAGDIPAGTTTTVTTTTKDDGTGNGNGNGHAATGKESK